jgi:C4-type Zn-finger protein
MERGAGGLETTALATGVDIEPAVHADGLCGAVEGNLDQAIKNLEKARGCGESRNTCGVEELKRQRDSAAGRSP